jgi:hypothetical protein
MPGDEGCSGYDIMVVFKVIGVLRKGRDSCYKNGAALVGEKCRFVVRRPITRPALGRNTGSVKRTRTGKDDGEGIVEEEKQQNEFQLQGP